MSFACLTSLFYFSVFLAEEFGMREKTSDRDAWKRERDERNTEHVLWRQWGNLEESGQVCMCECRSRCVIWDWSQDISANLVTCLCISCSFKANGQIRSEYFHNTELLLGEAQSYRFNCCSQWPLSTPKEPLWTLKTRSLCTVKTKPFPRILQYCFSLQKKQEAID